MHVFLFTDAHVWRIEIHPSFVNLPSLGGSPHQTVRLGVHVDLKDHHARLEGRDPIFELPLALGGTLQRTCGEAMPRL